jgi:hypothetical protein
VSHALHRSRLPSSLAAGCQASQPANFARISPLICCGRGQLQLSISTLLDHSRTHLFAGSHTNCCTYSLSITAIHVVESLTHSPTAYIHAFSATARFTCECWTGNFDASYLEELTRR